VLVVRKYAPEDTVLEGLENEAREAKKCLWADPQPVPPWEWRKKYPKQWVNPPRKSCLPLAAATSLLA
jgi:endonuclease YncB( thermonuclease family)